MNESQRSPARPRPAADPSGVAATSLVAAALLALARAARSVVLYDAENAAVRQLVGEYQTKMVAALAALGRVAITVRPFDLVVGGAVVYEDRDREKSIAFRLYRDGIRGLLIEPDVKWGELLALLEVIAVRYTAVRQQEDDAVTLLRKAEFERISMEYVEGFTPSEELPEPAADDTLDRPPRASPPPSWDTPLPKLPQPGPLAYCVVPEDALAPLRAEAADDAVGELAVSVARDLLALPLGPAWQRSRDLAVFFAELRDGLLTDRKIGSLAALVALLARSGADALEADMRRALGSVHALDLVLDAVPPGGDLPPEIARIAPLLGLDAIFEQLAATDDEARRRLLVGILKARLPQDVEAMVPRVGAVDASFAGELARAVVACAPDRAQDVARHLLARSEDRLRIDGLGLVESGSGPAPLAAVWQLVQSGSEDVRVRAIDVLGRRGEESLLEPLRELLESSRSPSPEEAAALGRAVAGVAPGRAWALFAPWLEPKARFLRGVTAHERALQWAAVAGTGVLPGPEAEGVLKTLASRGDAELRQHCLRALARRRGGLNGRR